MAPPRAKRTILSLAQRVKVLDMSSGGKSAQKIAEELGVGKTQIQAIIRDRENVLKDVAAGVPSSNQRGRRRTGLEDVNSVVWSGFRSLDLNAFRSPGRCCRRKRVSLLLSWGTRSLLPRMVGWRHSGKDMAFPSWRFVARALMFPVTSLLTGNCACQ